jgi:hypothetical protein
MQKMYEKIVIVMALIGFGKKKFFSDWIEKFFRLINGNYNIISIDKLLLEPKIINYKTSG